MKGLGLLDNLIVGRVDPHIYAFSTNTVPNYLKVGDTYRPVPMRLKECRNLGLNKDVLEALMNYMDKFMLRKLDYKIQNLNQLSHDEGIPPLERASVANQKFGKLGESQVVTPSIVCDDMISLIPEKELREYAENNRSILDIASKEGEFAIALYKRYKTLGFNDDTIKNIPYSIPTSSITYEFTRKIYEVLKLNTSNIAEQFTSYDLLGIKIDGTNDLDFLKIKAILNQDKSFNKISLKDEIAQGCEEDMLRFNAVVGNPPYQENIGSQVNKSLSKQLYPSFIMLAVKMLPEYLTMITPSRWFTGNAQDRSFVRLRDFMRSNNHISNIVNYLNSSDVFEGVSVPGGVNYFLYKKGYSGNISFKEISKNNTTVVKRPLFEQGLDIVLPINRMISILRKVTSSTFQSMEAIVTGRNPFGIPATNAALNRITSDTQDSKHDTKILCAYEQIKFISNTAITRNKELSKNWKVFTSKMNGGAGTLLDEKAVSILGRTFVMGPDSICSNTLLAIGGFKQQYKAKNLNKYMNTKFFRCMLGIKKVAQVLTSNIYQYVPQQDFTKNSDINWQKSIPEIDIQLYAKYNLAPKEIDYIESKIKPAFLSDSVLFLN